LFLLFLSAVSDEVKLNKFQRCLNMGILMSEIEEKIDECIAEIKPYRMYSSEVNNAIKSLETLKEQLKNITKENIDEVIRSVEEGYRGSLAYASYIPKTVENLKFIKEYLEKKKAEEY
jgi:hypothetical protein